MTVFLAAVCLSGCADRARPGVGAPGGARISSVANRPLPEGTRLVEEARIEPALPHDLLALSPSYRVEQRAAIQGLDLEVVLPTYEAGAEIYASNGEAWSRVATVASGGALRGALRDAHAVIVARTRPLVWHEVTAPAGGRTSFAFTGRRIFAVSTTLGPVVSTDQGETWAPVSKNDSLPRQVGVTPVIREAPEGSSGAQIMALASGGERLFAALDDGTVRFSEDQGASWHDYSGGLPTGAGGLTVLAANGSVVFASRGGRTFKARAP
ncbi:MAG: exo-alpha-sialidase [Deltaproteobacteria bacterium]|nr:exo-alpha-sialidase [Deltaproteobacteria bacterium]